MAGKRNRRSYDEIIAALKQKVAHLEDRKRMKTIKVDPSMKLAQKLSRMLRSAEDDFLRAHRMDLANAAKAAYISFDGSMRAPH